MSDTVVVTDPIPVEDAERVRDMLVETGVREDIVHVVEP